MTNPNDNSVGREGTAAVMEKMTAGEYVAMLYKFFFEKGEKVPLSALPQQEVDMTAFTRSKSGLLGAWLGHSSILLNIDGYTVLTDPVFERKVSLVGPTRFGNDLPLAVDRLPWVDIVIVSHDHYDHLNKYSIQRLIGKAGRFVVPVGVGKHLRRWGVNDSQIVELKWWQEFRFDDKLLIAATPSQHFSGRGLFDRNSTLWASWVISTDNHRVFFSGDSGYFAGFKEIGRKYGPFDLAYMECGAYDSRWSGVHMLPEQTVQAFTDVGGRFLQPIHWATFNLALHPWYEPVERVVAEAWRRKVDIGVPKIGQLVDYTRPAAMELWWVPAMVESKSRVAGQRQVQGAL